MKLVDQVRVRFQLPPPGLAKAIRQAAGVSQGAVARELGVHRVTVARWESGERSPRPHHLRGYLALLEDMRREVDLLGRKPR